QIFLGQIGRLVRDRATVETVLSYLGPADVRCPQRAQVGAIHAGQEEHLVVDPLQGFHVLGREDVAILDGDGDPDGVTQVRHVIPVLDHVGDPGMLQRDHLVETGDRSYLGGLKGHEQGNGCKQQQYHQPVVEYQPLDKRSGFLMMCGHQNLLACNSYRSKTLVSCLSLFFCRRYRHHNGIGAGCSAIGARGHRTTLTYQQHAVTGQGCGAGQSNPVAADAHVEAAPGVFTDGNNATDTDDDQAAVRCQAATGQSGLERSVVGGHQGDFLPGIAEVIGTEHVATQTPGNHATGFTGTGYTEPGTVIGCVLKGFPGIAIVGGAVHG